MATPIQNMIPLLDREVNAPGAELYPTASAAQKVGYLTDGFWEARLLGMLTEYTVRDGTEFTVLEGPEHANGYTWWKLEAADGTQGWGAANWLRLKTE